MNSKRRLAMGKPESIGAIRLLLVLLTIPLVAFIAARGIEWKLDSTLRSALMQELPERTTDISNASVSAWCGQPDVRADADVSEVCNLSDNMQLVKSGALVAALLGITMLIAIKTAGNIKGVATCSCCSLPPACISRCLRQAFW